MTTESSWDRLSFQCAIDPSRWVSVGPEEFVGLVSRLTDGRSSKDEPGLVVWITGLSGAGKTTVAERLFPLFQTAARSCVVLDGDVLRALLRDELGFEPGHGREHRLLLARLYGRLCCAIAGQGHDVLCATVSMFHEVRDWNRANIPRYLEIYLRVPLDELRRRDPKGLYGRSAGIGMVGVEVPAEEPRTADLVIDHHPDRTRDDTVQDIWRVIRER